MIAAIASARTLFVTLCVLLQTSLSVAAIDGDAFSDLVQNPSFSQMDSESYLKSIETRDKKLADFYQQLKMLVLSIPAEVDQNKVSDLHGVFYEKYNQALQLDDDKSFERDYLKPLTENQKKLVMQGLIDLAAVSYFYDQNCALFEKTVSVLWNLGKVYKNVARSNLGFFKNENSVVLTTLYAMMSVFQRNASEKMIQISPNKCDQYNFSPEIKDQMKTINLMLSPLAGVSMGGSGRVEKGVVVHQYRFARYAWDQNNDELLDHGMQVVVGWVEKRGSFLSSDSIQTFAFSQTYEEEVKGIRKDDMSSFMEKFSALHKMMEKSRK